MFKIFQKLFCVIFLLLAFPIVANATVLYLEPASGVYGSGDSFLIDVKIDVEEDCINTIEAGIRFPREHIQVEDFLTGESLLSVWVEKPSTDDIAKVNQAGILKFSGGIPGGYCGRIPGDPGESNIIGRIIFYVPKFMVGKLDNGSVKLDFADDQTQVLINDGFGTKGELATKGSELTISKDSVSPVDAWEEQVAKDKIPPEPFIIELQSRQDIFGGKYYINFHTIDKQSGVDRYEVLEIRPGEEVGVIPQSNFWEKVLNKERPAPEWKRGSIPYLLDDQELLSIIKVKAVDKAGNERLSEYIPPSAQEAQIQQKEKTQVNYILIYAIIAAGLISIIGAIIFIVKTKKISNHKPSKYEEDNNEEFKK